MSMIISYQKGHTILKTAPVVMSFLTLQRYKVTVLFLLNRELYCLKLTRDYVTTLTNYKG